MIAMSLALDPEIVVMDEPTTALDVVTQREILDEIMALKDRLGFALIFITHDFSLLLEIADTIAVMYAGEIVERAPAKLFSLGARHPYTKGLLNSFPPLHGARVWMDGIPGSPPDLRVVPQGCPFQPRCFLREGDCVTIAPRLRLAPGGSDARHVVSCLHADRSTPGKRLQAIASEEGHPGPPSTGASDHMQRSDDKRGSSRESGK
jgi:peptide/nickel transport system ATP-binding protein